MLNIVRNAFKNNNLRVMFGKIFARLESDTSVAARKWAAENVTVSTSQYCRSIDADLWVELQGEIDEIAKTARERLKGLNLDLGGGGNFPLLYFLSVKYRLSSIVETGVAAGWSSLTFLRALERNGGGVLLSSDFPYFRLPNPEQYSGYVAKAEVLSCVKWHLALEGDEITLKKFSSRLSGSNVDLFHYDSDKSYLGRNRAIKDMGASLSEKTILVFDDIQDNFHFRDFVTEQNINFSVFEFEGKYIGLVNPHEIGCLRSGSE